MLTKDSKFKRPQKPPTASGDKLPRATGRASRFESRRYVDYDRVPNSVRYVDVRGSLAASAVYSRRNRRDREARPGRAPPAPEAALPGNQASAIQATR